MHAVHFRQHTSSFPRIPLVLATKSTMPVLNYATAFRSIESHNSLCGASISGRMFVQQSKFPPAFTYSTLKTQRCRLLATPLVIVQASEVKRHNDKAKLFSQNSVNLAKGSQKSSPPAVCAMVESETVDVAAAVADSKRKTLDWANIATNLTIFGGSFAVLLQKGYSVEAAKWTDWTAVEKANRAALDLWSFYETNSLLHPFLVPAIITGVTYAVADWISQTYEGRFALDFDNLRLARNAAIGFLLLGPFAATYYQTQDLFFQTLLHGETPWWDIPAHIAIDQTLYASAYNVLFYSSVGLLRGDGFSKVKTDLTRNFWRLMKAGWRLWPFVHIITYNFIPSEHKVLWVDAVEIVWATILTLAVNEKQEEIASTLESLDESPAKDLVIEAIEEIIVEVREKEWEQELVPEILKEPAMFKSENIQETLLAEMEAGDSANVFLNQIIEQEELFLENEGLCIPSQVADEMYVTDENMMCAEPEISTLPLVEQVQLANVLEEVLAENRERVLEENQSEVQTEELEKQTK